MSKVLKCSLNKQKNPLKLMEMPENGPLHSYGDPVSKSINPCTVKQVQSLKENAKWVSDVFMIPIKLMFYHALSVFIS